MSTNGPYAMYEAVEQRHVYAIGHLSCMDGGHNHATCIGDYTTSRNEWDVVVGQSLFGVPIPPSVREFILANPSKTRKATREFCDSAMTLGLDSRQIFVGVVHTLWSLAGEVFDENDPRLKEIP